MAGQGQASIVRQQFVIQRGDAVTYELNLGLCWDKTTTTVSIKPEATPRPLSHLCVLNLQLCKVNQILSVGDYSAFLKIGQFC